MADINPRVDIAFKKIFGSEENKDLLISLINAIVGEEDQVKEVTLLNPYNAKSFKNDKLSILDIKAKNQDGKYYNIEIQISDEADYDKRALYYWARLYSSQLKSSQDYSVLTKAIGIHILNFTSIPEVNKYHNVFRIREDESGLSYFKDLELHTLELSKYCEAVRPDLLDMAAKAQNALDRWMAFLTRHDLLQQEVLPKALEDQDIKKALDVLSVMNMTPEEQDEYEAHLKWFRIQTNTLRNIEQKGEEKGRAEGRAKAQKEMAQKLLLSGMSRQQILDITGVDPDA